MVIGSRQGEARRSSGLSRMFIDHPRSLGMSWFGHGVGAVRIGFRLIGAGSACIVHALVPGWFTQTAGRTVDRTYREMTHRRATAANPEDWPDYEI
jgi:hypothetical protein